MPAPSTTQELRQIEAAVLGAAVMDQTACASLVAAFDASGFTEPAYRALAERIEDLFARGEEVSTTSLEASGADRGVIVEVVTATAGIGGMPTKIRILTEALIAREAFTTLRRALAAVEQARQGDADVFDVLTNVQHELSNVQLTAERAARGDTHIRHAVAEALMRVQEWREGEATDFAPSGFYELDRIAGGYPVGELTTLAAESGAGKTSIVCHCARAIAQIEMKRLKERGEYYRPRVVVVFSAEMSREQIAHRVAAGLAKVNLRDLRSGDARNLDPEAYERLERALGLVAKMHIHVDDEPAPSLAYIAARLQQIRQRESRGGETSEFGLIAVDYDEKVDSEGETEELRVSAVAKGLKNVGKRFAAPILGLSQYSNVDRPWTRPPDDKRLRYSGKKFHESAMVVHWSWPGLWLEKKIAENEIWGLDINRPQRGKLIVTKNRFGPLGECAIDFDAATTSFHDVNEPTIF